VVAGLHHFDEEQDPDSVPHQSEKTDPGPHQSEFKANLFLTLRPSKRILLTFKMLLELDNVTIGNRYLVPRVRPVTIRKQGGLQIYLAENSNKYGTYRYRTVWYFGTVKSGNFVTFFA
jgi:hypothetical protein